MLAALAIYVLSDDLVFLPEEMGEPPAIVPVCLVSFAPFHVLAVRQRDGDRVFKDVEDWLPIATRALHDHARALFFSKPVAQRLEIGVKCAELPGLGFRLSIRWPGEQAYRQKGLADIDAGASSITAAT